MPNLLAIDASTEVCSVAIGSDDAHWSRSCSEPRSHAKVLLPLIEELLEESGMRLDELDAIGVSAGPGSFTGIRIGLGVAQGLAYGAGVPLVGVDTLHLLAQTYWQSVDTCRDQTRLIAALDARMKEVYWAVFEVQGERLEVLREPIVSDPQVLADWLQENPWEPSVGMGHGWNLLNSEELSLCEPNLKPGAAAMLGFMGVPDKESSGSTLQRALIEPTYLRNEITWEKRKRIRTL